MSKAVRQVVALIGADAEVQAAAGVLWDEGLAPVSMRSGVRVAAAAAYGLPEEVIRAVGTLESVSCRTIEAAIGREVIYQEFAKSLKILRTCSAERVLVTDVRDEDHAYLAQLGVKVVEAAPRRPLQIPPSVARSNSPSRE